MYPPSIRTLFTDVFCASGVRETGRHRERVSTSVRHGHQGWTNHVRPRGRRGQDRPREGEVSVATTSQISDRRHQSKCRCFSQSVSVRFNVKTQANIRLEIP